MSEFLLNLCIWFLCETLLEFAATDAPTLTINTIAVIIVSFLTDVFVMNLCYRAPHPGKRLWKLQLFATQLSG